MAIELATQFQAYTDEQFYSESKTSLVTNKDFSFDGAKTIKLYKVKTTDMEDFNRNGPILDGNKSQYGTISTLQATTETSGHSHRQRRRGIHHAGSARDRGRRACNAVLPLCWC